MQILMRCPNDNTELAMTVRQGVEIDYCPQCRGVWLDRGELDKILDRSHSLYGKEPAEGPSSDNSRLSQILPGAQANQRNPLHKEDSRHPSQRHTPNDTSDSTADDATENTEKSYIKTRAPKERKRDDFLSEIFDI